MSYIFKLVWETQPLLLMFMLFLTIYNGVMPLAGTLISARLLDSVVRSFTEEVDLVMPLVLQFGYLFLNTLTGSLSSIFKKFQPFQLCVSIWVKAFKKRYKQVNRQDVEKTVTEYLKPIFGFALKRCKNMKSYMRAKGKIYL